MQQIWELGKATDMLQKSTPCPPQHNPSVKMFDTPCFAYESSILVLTKTLWDVSQNLVCIQVWHIAAWSQKLLAMPQKQMSLRHAAMHSSRDMLGWRLFKTLLIASTKSSLTIWVSPKAWQNDSNCFMFCCTKKWKKVEESIVAKQQKRKTWTLSSTPHFIRHFFTSWGKNESMEIMHQQLNNHSAIIRLAQSPMLLSNITEFSHPIASSLQVTKNLEENKEKCMEIWRFQHFVSTRPLATSIWKHSHSWWQREPNINASPYFGKFFFCIIFVHHDFLQLWHVHVRGQSCQALTSTSTDLIAAKYTRFVEQDEMHDDFNEEQDD